MFDTSYFGQENRNQRNNNFYKILSFSHIPYYFIEIFYVTTAEKGSPLFTLLLDILRMYFCISIPDDCLMSKHTGCFIMFSVITHVYNKKTKGPTLMELFTATEKLKQFFCYDLRCSMCAPRVTRHTSIRYSSYCHTRVNMGASIFFTAAMIRAFRSARSRGNGGTNTLHEMQVAQ